MTWKVKFHKDFQKEHAELPEQVKRKLTSVIKRLSNFGPNLGRPTVETLKGSSYSNMKELRFKCLNQEWRVAFVFDPARRAVLLVAGSKSGTNQRQFYSYLVSVAERRYLEHLESF